MTRQEILTICTQFGIDRDGQGFGKFAAEHAFVVQDPKAKRSIGRVSILDMLAAYSRGIRKALSS
jgi:hypothetical protein